MTLALSLSLALSAGAVAAQSCLSYADGLGNTTLTCPDGRTGYIHTGPGGVASGMLGSQPFQAPAGVLVMPQSDPLWGVPATAYVTMPPAPPLAAGPPPPTAPAAASPPLTPAPELTALQSQYLQERRAAALRQALAKRKAGEAAPTPAKTPETGGGTAAR